MQIMVIDRDALTTQLLSSRLEAKGHRVVAFQNKNEAFEEIRQNDFDCILVDAAPLAEPKPVIIAVRRQVTSDLAPSVLLLSKTASSEEAIRAGANDVLLKPFSFPDIELKLQNAVRLRDIHQHLMESERTPPARGMIDKSAFYQLYLAAQDRASRYGERTLLAFLHLAQNQEPVTEEGEEAAVALRQTLAQTLTLMRRQSDVIADLGPRDFVILLQRPQNDSEPIEALQRFAESLQNFTQKYPHPGAVPHLELHLVEIPQGTLLAEHHIAPWSPKTLQG